MQFVSGRYRAEKAIQVCLLCMVMYMPYISFAEELTAIDLTYMAEDYPPANYLDEGELKGASIEILKLIWKKLNVPEQQINIVPWARGYRELHKNKNTVLFSMSRTENRENLFKWVGPIFSARHVLIGLKKNNFDISSLENCKKYKIGTIRDDIGEKVLIDAGFEQDKLESVTRLDQNVRKLLTGRVDLISQSEDSVNKYIALHKLDPELFTMYFVINEKFNYYAFNKEKPDSLIEQFQTALDSLKKERNEIIKKYKMHQ